MTIRTRRLNRDYEKVLAELAASDCARVQVVAGDPPNHYQITYDLEGLMWDETSGDVKPIGKHVVDIHLPLGYPKQAPRCTMRTPVWHPNIGDYVCIGDYWSAGVTLVDIIAHIGDMLQYKTYNLHSPVNKTAAAWAERNLKSFPIGTKNIVPPSDADAAPAVGIEIALRTDDLDISLGPIRERN